MKIVPQPETHPLVPGWDDGKAFCCLPVSHLCTAEMYCQTARRHFGIHLYGIRCIRMDI